MATTAVIDLSKFAKITDVITRIKTDTTVYLSPTGSDTTGDGSSSNPFFSIKRAVLWLNDYSLDPDVYVTIRGLAGTYNYNNNHKAYLIHPDAERVKIHFDSTGGANTLNNGSNFNIVSDGSNGYRVSFGVSSTTGLEAGQYVQIVSDTYGLSALYNGFFKLYAVNHGSNILTIEYNGYGNIKIAPTAPSNGSLYVRRHATHINSSCTNGTFLYIKGGIFSIQIFGANANTENHNHDFVTLKYAFVNSSLFCANGFNKGMYMRESDISFSIGNDGVRISNCYEGIYCDKGSVLNTSGIWCSLNNKGVVFNAAIGGNDTARFGAVNNSYVGLEIGYISGYIADAISIGSVTLIGNQVGSWTIFGSLGLFNGLYSGYNDNGVTSSYNSQVILNFLGSHETIIEHNTLNGVYVSNGSVDLSSSTIYNNYNGVYASNASIINTRDYVTLKDVDITYNECDAICQTKGGISSLNYVTARYNAKNGIICDSVILEMTHCDSSYNSTSTDPTLTVPNAYMHSGCIVNCYYCTFNNSPDSHGFDLGWASIGNFFECDFNYNFGTGLFVEQNSTASYIYSNANDNNTGVYVTNCSGFTMYGDSSSKSSYLNNNTDYGLRIDHNSRASIRLYSWISGNGIYNILCSHASTVSDTANTQIINNYPPTGTNPYYNGSVPDYRGSFIVRNQ